MELQVGVKIFLKNKDGRILLLKRNPKKYPHVGDELWDIAGGRIDAGMPLMDNLKREVHEETGMDLAGTPKLIAAQDILKVAGKHVVRLTYVGNASGDPVLDTEHTDFGWFTIEEILQLHGLDRFAKEVALREKENIG